MQVSLPETSTPGGNLFGDTANALISPTVISKDAATAQQWGLLDCPINLRPSVLLFEGENWRVATRNDNLVEAPVIVPA